MGELVNLNAYRKRLKREADNATAAENRIRHGATRAQRQREAAKSNRETTLLDGKKRALPAAPDGKNPDDSS